MKNFTLKKVLMFVVPLAVALVSVFYLSRLTSDPVFHQKSLAALEEKQTTVLELTAASTGVSVGITLLPGDAATPIAEKLADLSGCFLVVLCAIFLEKYLLTITCLATFRVLIPAACLLLCINVFADRNTLRELARKLVLFALAIVLVIPASIGISNLIETTYQTSIDSAIDSAKQATTELESTPHGSAQEDSQSGLSGLFSKVTGSITGIASSAVQKLTDALNRFIEAAAVLLVTSCLIPILVLLFFLWLVKLVLGVNLYSTNSSKIFRANSDE